jgi:hypothetical protein
MKRTQKPFRFSTPAQIERRAAKAELRRRQWREAHPDLDPRAWSALASGHSSLGVKAVREWLRSVDALALSLTAAL